MELITANFSGTVRRERFDGRDFLVAPLSMIVPGVLNGSNGPLLYELADIEASYDAWNGMPLVVNHPKGADGKPVSARSPRVFEQYGIGHVYNSKVDGKLIAEGWFDVEKTRRIDNRVLIAVESGSPMSLSTGLNLDQEPRQGIWNNAMGESIQYTAVARRYRPDHLAILPDDKGACDVGDGCGLNINEANAGQVVPLLQKIAEAIGVRKKESPILNTEEPEMAKLSADDRTKLIDTLVANCDCWKDDRATLEKSDDKLLTSLNTALEANTTLKQREDAIKAQETIINKAKEGFKIGDQQYVLNEKGEYVAKEKVEQKTEQTPAPTLASVENANQRLTPQEQAAISYGMRIQNERKTELINLLVENISDEATKAAQKERLAKRELEDLEADAALLPKKQTSNQEYTDMNASRLNYLGAGAGQQVNNNEKKLEPALGIPTWNFEPTKN